ncbi:MAG: AAA family ATPase, partial [Colwellia sp.]|nr:AAA family ATPase [Colwellia sp.]
MKLPKLPIGIQTFRDIRNKKDNYLYIDKTDIALNLIENSRYIFLSRPQRFGKSLLMDTIQEIFQGNKALFEGLAIYEQWDWEVTYPVIKIDFFGDLRSGESLKRNILSTLKSNQKRLNVDCESVDDFGLSLKVLIENSYEHYNQKVVILIDEYDKAILDNLDQIDVAKENREILKSFYTVIKGCDQYIKFTMLTGVSKFSKASIFSGLNMLKDISLTPKYGNICGYTQANIENEFLPYLEGVDLEKLKAWYNGYNFLKDDVYNPFDILLFIDNEKIYKNYWFSTGTPTFLIKWIEKNNHFLHNLANLILDEK